MVYPSGTDSPGLSRTKGRKTVVVVVVVVVVMIAHYEVERDRNAGATECDAVLRVLCAVYRLEQLAPRPKCVISRLQVSLFLSLSLSLRVCLSVRSVRLFIVVFLRLPQAARTRIFH